MTPIPLEPPALEPVSFDEAKIWLRAQNPEESDLVSTLLVAARMIVEAETGQRLITQTWRLVMDGWPADGTLRLPLRPLVSVDALRLYDADGTARLLAPDAFLVDLAGDPARIVFSGPPPAPGRPVSGIEVDLTVGFGEAAADVPPPLRQAVLLLMARWYAARDDRTLRIDGGLPPDIAGLVAPWCRRRL